MHLAITGGSGHLGTVLLPLLLGQGHRLRLLVHQRTDGLAQEGVEHVQGDLLDAGAVDRLVAGCDAVLHLAARISIDSANDPLVRRVNVDGTRHLVEAAVRHRVRRMVHLSSIHSYDSRPLHLPLNETRGPARADAAVYDRSKAEADTVVQQAIAGHGLSALILAPTSVIGPPDPRPSLMGRAIADLHDGRVPLLPPGGFDFVDVRDVAAVVATAVTANPAGTKYLLSGRYLSLRALAETIGRLTGRRSAPRTAPPWLLRGLVPLFGLQARLTGRPPLMTREALNTLLEGHTDIRSDRARAELGFRPRPIEDTLADTLDWMRGAGMLRRTGQR